MKKNKLLFLSALFINYSFSQNVSEAKIYQNYPKGMQMLQTGYLLQTTNSTVDGNVTLPNNLVDVNANIGYLRYASFFDFLGKTAGVQVMLPYAAIDANLLGIDADTNGIGDMMFIFGANIFGGDAMNFGKFLQSPKQTAMGWSVAVTAPTGRYDSDKLVNIGGNRWQFKPELAVTVPVGKWDFEGYLAVKFFTKNNKMPSLLPNSDEHSLSQKPFYSLTGHAVYNFTPQLWASLDISGRTGGETSQSGVKQHDSQQILGIGGTLTYIPVLYHQFGLTYLTRAAGNEYAANGAQFTLKYTYVFGGGIQNTIKSLKQ